MFTNETYGKYINTGLIENYATWLSGHKSSYWNNFHKIIKLTIKCVMVIRGVILSFLFTTFWKQDQITDDPIKNTQNQNSKKTPKAFEIAHFRIVIRSYDRFPWYFKNIRELSQENLAKLSNILGSSIWNYFETDKKIWRRKLENYTQIQTALNNFWYKILTKLSLEKL